MKSILIILMLMASLISCRKEEMTSPKVTSFATAATTTLQAEDALLSGAIPVNGIGAGWTGTGYADYQNVAGDYIEWTLNSTIATSTAILNFRYSNGSSLYDHGTKTTDNRMMELKINGIVADANLDFPRTANWLTWSNALSHEVSLVAGENKIRLTAIGYSGSNMDYLTWSNAVEVMPTPDHIIFVWMENHGYSQIIGSSNAPYINSLRAKGTLFTNSFATTHPSYPNYIQFFSGQINGVTSNDCINTTTLTTPNLYSQLKLVGKTFAWYSEDLPAMGSTICTSGSYREKHNPVTIFSNVSTIANKPFSMFPTDFTKLENVVCITPNQDNDMHDGTISQGDTWVKNKLSALAEWCRTHNSIFVVYMDEDDGNESNHIPIVAVGQHVKANYTLATHYDHFNWTKTISAMFNASTTWTTNLSSRNSITGCWN